MKLEKVEIEWTRGIVETTLELQGNNFLVSGRNGAGKSAVVDAIDLLVKGGMTRLEGEGTASISLKKHGAHIDAKTKKKESVVKGYFRDNAGGKTAIVTRTVGDPDHFTIEGPGANDCMTLMSATKDKQFILTRRQILLFIAAPPKDRLEQVAALLNLTDVENVRASLQKIRNETKRAATERQNAEKSALVDLHKEAGIASGAFDSKEVLKRVNELRQQLGVAAISKLEDGITSGIAEPGATTAQNKVNWTAVSDNLSAIEKFGEASSVAERRQLLRKSTDRLAILSENPQASRALRAYHLVELGEALLQPGSQFCPLCDKDWEYEQLRAHLAEKRELAVQSSKELEEIRQELRPVLVQAGTFLRSVQSLRVATQALIDPKEAEALDTLTSSLTPLESETKEALGNLHLSESLLQALTEFGVSELESSVFKKIKESTPKGESAETSKRERWDILSRIGKSLESFQKAIAEHAEAEANAKLAEQVFDRYQRSRSKVLGTLYASIRDRFVELYRMIHGDDEAGFNATMDPTDAGIELQVEFYGRGNHHPCAMHSEGHQDSMGLCLFLALVERLNANCFPIIVLDDVLTSVDDSHRKELVMMLKSQFPNWQFIITTHEELWARQLRKYGLVDKKGHVEFYGWTVDGGPRHRQLLDFQEKAQIAVNEERKTDAAVSLRNGLEAFYRDACDSVGGIVTFKVDGEYDLGMLLDPTLKKYEKLLQKGMDYAKSTGDSAKEELLKSRKERLQKARLTYADENWIMNPNVHFNEWATFSKGDLQNLLDAHVELCNCLRCDDCGSLLEVRREGPKEFAVQCSCGKCSWFVDKPN